jgi:hypothetical protein
VKNLTVLAEFPVDARAVTALVLLRNYPDDWRILGVEPLVAGRETA